MRHWFGLDSVLVLRHRNFHLNIAHVSAHGEVFVPWTKVDPYEAAPTFKVLKPLLQAAMQVDVVLPSSPPQVGYEVTSIADRQKARYTGPVILRL